MEKLSFRTYLLFSCIALMLISVALLGGGLTEDITYSIILILTGLSAFLLFMIFYEEKKVIIWEKQYWLLFFIFVFLLSGIISSFYSIRPYNSWSEFIMLIAGFVIFFIFTQLGKESIAKLLSCFLVIIGAILSITGFILLITSTQLSDLRMGSLFYNPNLLAGFLIAVIPLNIFLLVSAKKFKIKIFLLFLLAINISAFFLTLSYSAFSAIFPILLITSFIFRKKIFTKKVIKNIFYTFLAILFIFFSIRFLTIYKANVSSTFSSTISQAHTISSYQNRIEFIKAGFKIFIDCPLTGLGLDNMKLAADKYLSHIIEKPKSLHNNYLDLLTQLGIFGLLSYLSFIVYLTFKFLKIFREKNNYLYFSIFVAWLSLLIHGALDFSWQLKITYLLFFIFSGLLCNFYLQNSEKKQIKIKAIIYIILIFCFIIFVARAIQIYYGQYYQNKATIAEDSMSYDNAIKNYQQAWQWNKDPKFISRIGILQYTQAQKIDDKKNEYLAAADISAHEWQKSNAYDSGAYQLLGKIQIANGKNTEAEASLIKALSLTPYNNIEIMLDYAAVLNLNKKYQDCINSVNNYMNIYPTIKTYLTHQDYLQDIIKQAKLLDLEAEAYLAINNKEEAIKTWEKALQINSQSQIIKDKLEKNQ